MRAGDRRHKGDTFRQPLPWVRKTPTTQSDVVAAGEAVGLKSGEGFSRRVTRARSVSLVVAAIWPRACRRSLSSPSTPRGGGDMVPTRAADCLRYSPPRAGATALGGPVTEVL